MSFRRHLYNRRSRRGSDLFDFRPCIAVVICVMAIFILGFHNSSSRLCAP
jgi:hypothetical protein